MVENPFVFSEGSEKLVGRQGVFEELFQKTKSEKSPFIFFVGRIGSGRTFFIKKLKDKLEKETEIDFDALTFTSRALKDIENLPDEPSEGKVVYAIDMFERVSVLEEDEQEEAMELIKNKNGSGIGFILLITPRVVEHLKKSYSEFIEKGEIVKLGKLTLKEARELVKLKLDKIDESFPDIFSRKDFKRIWKESGGNARTLLLTCASLFEEKVK